MKLKIDHQKLIVFAALWILALQAMTSVAGPPSPDQLAFFEAKVRPLLVRHCYECHSSNAEKLKGGLLLDSKEGWTAGGDSGDVIDFAKPGDSLLLETVRYQNASLQMPPTYQLSPAEIDVLENWIEMGAPDPRTGAVVKKAAGIDWEQGRQHWSFQPVANPIIPTVSDGSWTRDDIDYFILEKLESAKLKPVPDADRFALIRRVSLDLTGLPPTVDEVDTFVRDPSSDDEALAKVVDRLLKSSAYGERWGRHWLDVARYADSVGKTRNVPYPYAWRYRDYVIDAFNADKPYNEFLTEQVAGDLLPAKDQKDHEENLIATGLLALGSMDLNERDADQFQLDRIDDQMDTLGRATMGMTLGCARCHDHKFDPIAQTDYYAMAGIFASTKTLSGHQSRQGGSKEYHHPELLARLDAPTTSRSTAANKNESGKIEELRDRQRELYNEAKSKKGDKRALAPLRIELAKITQQLVRLGESAQPGDAARKYAAPAAPVEANASLAMAVVDGRVSDLALRVRGESDIKGDVVPRAFPTILKLSSAPSLPADGSGRLELAQWLTSRDHPLTARVMVNRIWAHLLGRGIVETMDNFGASGAAPTHPELHDHLATRFMEDGWSVKRLVRAIVLSRTYRLSGQTDSAREAIDESNRLYWRSNLRRLEAEAIRDSLLVAGGMLMAERPQGAPFNVPVGIDISKADKKGRGMTDFTSNPVRSVYLPVFRSRLPGMFTVFDFAEPDQVNGQRDVTTVPPQALFLLNSSFAVDVSKLAAERILQHPLKDDQARVQYAYVYALCRYPTEAESARALEFIGTGNDRLNNWSAFTQALYSAAEFRYLP